MIYEEGNDKQLARICNIIYGATYSPYWDGHRFNNPQEIYDFIHEIISNWHENTTFYSCKGVNIRHRKGETMWEVYFG